MYIFFTARKIEKNRMHPSKRKRRLYNLVFYINKSCQELKITAKLAFWVPFTFAFEKVPSYKPLHNIRIRCFMYINVSFIAYFFSLCLNIDMFILNRKKGLIILQNNLTKLASMINDLKTTMWTELFREKNILIYFLRKIMYRNSLVLHGE